MIALLCALFVASLPAQDNHFGVGATFGTPGPGVQAAVKLNRISNIRASFDFFSFGDSLSQSGINYNYDLRLRSFGVMYDMFPLGGGFHISPGLWIHDGNRVAVTGAAPTANLFTFNNASYRSSPTDPAHGNGTLSFNSVAPVLTVGFGNLVPRNGKHWTFPIEAGFAYQGDPNVTMNILGSVCDATGRNCRAVTADPTAQSNIADERRKLQDNASFARFYPIVSFGVGFSF
jgi:hypothetical protein